MDIISVSSNTFNGVTVQTVNARDLHAFLESKQDFSTWIKGRIEQYGFVEGVDYLVHKFMEQLPSGAKQKIDYYISLDMAKELSMVERNDKGKEARQYFLECERRAKDPMQMLSDPNALRQALLTYSEKVIALQAANEAMQPKVAALDRIATASDGSLCITDAAKTLQVGPKWLFGYLHESGWTYRRPMGAGWLAHQNRIRQGLMEHKTTTGMRPDGSEWTDTQPRVTAKGLAKLAEMIEEGKAA
jgi:phage anti-repressor protein/phage antirepressor YoqD-like protein